MKPTRATTMKRRSFLAALGVLPFVKVPVETATPVSDTVYGRLGQEPTVVTVPVTCEVVCLDTRGTVVWRGRVSTAYRDAARTLIVPFRSRDGAIVQRRFAWPDKPGWTEPVPGEPPAGVERRLYGRWSFHRHIWACEEVVA
jgi:hypothetical protein